MNNSLTATLKPALAIIMFAFAFASCKKLDTGNVALHEKDFAEKFFKAEINLCSPIAAIIEKLKTANERTGFVDKLPKNCGLPLWEKVASYKRNEETNVDIKYNKKLHGPGADLNGEEEDDATFIIPLTNNNTNLSSIVVVKEEGGTIAGIDCYTVNDYLYYLCNNLAVNIVQAEHMLELFMITEYRTFGTSKFYHIPSYLFANRHCDTLTDGTKSIEIYVPPTSSLLDLSQFTCYYVFSGVCTCAGGVCVDWMYGCSVCSATYCVNTGGDTEEPGGDGGGGGGGGTTPGGGTPGGGGGGTPPGNPNPTPDPTPCPFTGAWYSLMPNPCNPLPPPNPKPPKPNCDEFVQNLENNVGFIGRMKFLQSDIALGAPNEVGYEIRDISQYNSNTYFPATGSPAAPTIDWQFPANSLQEGLIHSHYAGLNSIFTPQDVILMAQLFLGNHAKDTNNLFFAMTSSYATPFLMKVGNVTQFRAFCKKIVGDNGNDQKAIKDFIDQFNKKIDSEDPDKNEKEFLKIIKRYGGEDALKLYSGTNDCNKWTQRKVDNFDTVSSVECINGN